MYFETPCFADTRKPITMGYSQSNFIGTAYPMEMLNQGF